MRASTAGRLGETMNAPAGDTSAVNPELVRFCSPNFTIIRRLKRLWRRRSCIAHSAEETRGRQQALGISPSKELQAKYQGRPNLLKLKRCVFRRTPRARDL